VSRSTPAAQDASVQSGNWTRGQAAAGRRPALRKFARAARTFMDSSYEWTRMELTRIPRINRDWFRENPCPQFGRPDSCPFVSIRG